MSEAIAETDESVSEGAAASGAELGPKEALALQALLAGQGVTRAAVAALDPWFVTAGRAAVAGLLAVGLLALTRAPWPSRKDWGALAVVAFGVVLGFPLFSALANANDAIARCRVAFGVVVART